MTVQHVESGDEFHFSAFAYNGMANAANFFQRNQVLSQQLQNLQNENNGIILVKNTTGSDRAALDTVALGSSLLDPDVNEPGYLERPAYNVVQIEDASPDNNPVIAILQEPLAVDATGSALVVGLTFARIIQNNANHRYATWTDNPSLLTSVEFGPIEILSIDGGTTSDRFALVRLLKRVETDRWRRLHAFDNTAASTSTITTTSDLTGIIKVGMPLRFGIDSAAGTGTATATGGSPVTTEFFYAMVTAITSNLITISGAPLPLSEGHLLSLYVGKPELLAMLSAFVFSNYADGTDTDLLANDMRSPFKWTGSTHYLVRISATQDTVDTGTEPSINVQLDNSAVLTTDIQLGAAGAWIDNSAVAFDVDNYSVELDDEVEIACTVAGGTGDARDLTVQLAFVAE